MSATRLASAATLATFSLGLAAADPLAAFRPASFGSPDPEDASPWTLPPPTSFASPPRPLAPALPSAPPPSRVAVAFSARDDLDYVPLYGLDDRDDVARDRRYASAVRDATDALEAALLDDALGPDDVRRDAALRLVLGDLREEIDRLLPPADTPVRPIRAPLHTAPLDAGHSHAAPAVHLTLANPSSVNPSLLRAGPAAPARVPYVSPARVPYAEQGVVGGFMQSLTWLFATPFADDPRFVDDWLRGSTLPRRCPVAETLRRCTYEPKGTWYRERRSRVNAPLDWPYCEDDLGLVYEHCTDAERQAGVCDPRVARNRAAFERSRRLEFLRQQAAYARVPGGIYRRSA
jgi:hypothetical protein